MNQSQNDRCSDYDRLCKSITTLLWSLHYSSDGQITEMIVEIKFAVINLLIYSWKERLTCFDCDWQMKLTSSVSRAACWTRACSMEKQTVARSGLSLVWRRRNQLLAGYFFICLLEIGFWPFLMRSFRRAMLPVFLRSFANALMLYFPQQKRGQT